MRREADETSEMVNQVLFGETFSLLEESRLTNFSYISLHHDKYEGWVNSKCIYQLKEKELEILLKMPVSVSHELVSVLPSTKTSHPLVIGSGSILRISSPGKTKTAEGEFLVPENNQDDTFTSRERIVFRGQKLLRVPYLWGGRSSFGLDCSGLCQNLFRQAGIEIPRDASVQAGKGKSINFIAEARPGDLAFFDNDEGKIIHVGMIVEEGKILHASGRVKIDSIDHQGIFSEEQNRYTHKLRLLKNLLD